MGDMEVMVITLESDLPKLTAITEEFFLEDTDMAATVITLERDLLKLTATMEEFLWIRLWWIRWIPRRKIDVTYSLFSFLSYFVQFYDFVILHVKFQQRSHKIKIGK